MIFETKPATSARQTRAGRALRYAPRLPRSDLQHVRKCQSCPAPALSSRHHFHAGRKPELVEKLFAVVPSQTESADVGHAEAGDQG